LYIFYSGRIYTGELHLCIQTARLITVTATAAATFTATATETAYTATPTTVTCEIAIHKVCKLVASMDNHLVALF
jgi:hypothetical protein